MYGLNGKILRINLSNGKSNVETFTEEYAKKYIGGKGFAIDILYKELNAGIDPLGP